MLSFFRYWKQPCLFLCFFTAVFFFPIIAPLEAGEILLKGKSSGMAFQVEKISQGHGVIWGMAFLNENEIIMTERQGNLKILNLSTMKVKRLTGNPEVMASGQGGLLDVKVPMNFKSGGWIYFTYSKPRLQRAATTLARARREGLRLVDWQDLLVSKSATRTGYHFGSRIAFDEQNHVFFGIGDRGIRKSAQDLSNHAGSILRLKLDGSIPVDNPFVQNPNVLPEIWSYGHRNPQGLAYDSTRKRLWEIEHGPRGGDEINHILPAQNYGWPVVSYGKEYGSNQPVGEATEKEGIESPVKVYIPSIAPGSLMLYSGKAFPKWKGDLFAGALKLTHLNHIQLNHAGAPIAEERLLKSLQERIRAIVQSPEGWIYLSTDTGQIMRVVPAQ